jgi:hypothetical protein
MTPLVAGKIMSGSFPMHAYLASIRPVTRVNKVQAPEIDDFVRATSGKGLGVRDLDILAKGYFLGGEEFRRQVREGDVRWCIEALRPSGEGGAAAAANDVERKLLVDMETVHRRIKRLLPLLQRREATYSPAFLAEAHLLCGGLQRWMPAFATVIKDFYARTRPQESDRGDAHAGDSQA